MSWFQTFLPFSQDPFHNNFTSDLLESPCMGGRKGRNGLFPATACLKLAGRYGTLFHASRKYNSSNIFFCVPTLPWEETWVVGEWMRFTKWETVRYTGRIADKERGSIFALYLTAFSEFPPTTSLIVAHQAVLKRAAWTITFAASKKTPVPLCVDASIKTIIK